MPERRAPRLRLLYVTARAPFGANETFVMDEVLALQARGHWVRLVPMLLQGRLAHAMAARLLPSTFAVAPWSPRVLLAALREFLRAPRRCLSALALVLTPRPRALLANLFVFPKALWLARRARELRVDHLHAHWATTPAALAMAAAHVAGLPWSFTAHRYDIDANDLFARKAADAAFARLISQDGLRRATDRCGAPADKLVLLHMGVALPGPRRVVRVGARPMRFLCPARLVAVKDHEDLLAAFARLRMPAELWLAGDGPLRGELARQLERQGFRSVRLLGQLPRERLLQWYARRTVDGVVLASRDEGIPVALMEAMAFGLPAIAPAVGGVSELLGDGAGLLVPPGDVRALAAAMRTLAADAPLRARLGRAGAARVARDFSVDTIALALEARFAATAPSSADSRSAEGMPKRTSPRYSLRYPSTSNAQNVSSVRPSSQKAAAGITAPRSSGSV